MIAKSDISKFTAEPRRLAFRRNISGSIASLTALMLAVFIGCLALAVDMATLFVERRQMQGAADLAAMAAAADLDNAAAAAAATLAANGYPNLSGMVVELGSYQPDPTVNYTRRFSPGVGPFNAARVAFSKPGTLYFARVFTHRQVTISVAAVSANGNLAAFSLGSRLLAVNGGLTNAVLGALLGSNVNLSVMDYNALVSGNVSLLPYLTAVGTRLNITAGTYDTVLNSSANIGTLLSALADVSQAQGQYALNAAVTNLLRQGKFSSLSVPLSSLFDLGPIGSLQLGQQVQGFGATVNAMDIISGGAVIANRSSQVSVDLGANVPGVLSAKLDLAIGQPMQHSGYVAVGQQGSVLNTAQTRMRLIVTIGGSGLLAGTTITLPLYLDIATGTAALSSVVCSANGGGTVTIAATPGVADVWIGTTATDMTNFNSSMTVTPATLVSLPPLVSVTGSSHVYMGNLSPTALQFSQSDIDDQTIKTTDTRNLIQSLVTSTLANLQLKLNVVGLGLGVPSGITGAVATQLGAVAAPLDDVVYNLLTVLGVHVGEVDVQVNGVRCNGTGQLAG